MFNKVLLTETMSESLAAGRQDGESPHHYPLDPGLIYYKGRVVHQGCVEKLGLWIFSA